MSTDTKIRKLVREVIPKSWGFKIVSQPVGFGPFRILRVITPAWRSLPRFVRILRVQDAIAQGLTQAEQKKIFRISVLTAEEYQRHQPFFQAVRAPLAR